MFHAPTTLTVHRDDQLGRLALSDEGIAARERLVMQACLAARVPLAAAIGGGYQAEHDHIVRRHMHLHRAAAEHMPAFAQLMDSKRPRAAVRQQHAAGGALSA
jgi:acetoin utilization deacetylase AcuC-like enzyme